jgi:hypothetical protein
VDTRLCPAQISISAQTFAHGNARLQTLTSSEIDYIAASFRAWCAAQDKPAPTADDASAYLSHVQANEPFVAERIDDDWDDFIAFLHERQLVQE